MKSPEEVIGEFLAVIGDANISEDILAIAVTMSEKSVTRSYGSEG